MKSRRWLLGLVAFAWIVGAALYGSRVLWTSDVRATQAALEDFVELHKQHRKRYGHLPGDLNHDGEIDAGVEVAVTIAGRRVVLRAVARQASALANPPRGRNVIDVSNLPCGIAQELDARVDDGNLAKGSVRASVASCSDSDPVPVVAVALPL